MPKFYPHSLRSLLLVYETAFLLLVIVTGALGGLWAYYWQQSSQESVRINALLNEAQQIRGDLYRQLKEVNRARLLEDPGALDQYANYLERIGEHFDQLRLQTKDDGEALAVDYMQKTYRTMRDEMNKIFADPYQISEAVRMKILDPLYEEWMLAEFESALVIFSEIIEQRQRDLVASLNYWTRLAPLLIPAPILMAIALLLLSRHSLQRRFVRPMRDLAAGARQISRGHLDHRISSQGVAEVAQLGRAFNEMAADLATSRDALVASERQAALGALVPVVAHNIRNPLASIRATAQLIDKTDDAEELFETRGAIIDTVDRLERWVSSLLFYLHPLKPHRALIRLAAVVDGALAPLAVKLREKQINLKRRGWDLEQSVLVDIDLLEQALYGLLNNAVDASPHGAELVLSLSCVADEAVLVIADQGPGIPFDPRPNDLEPVPSTKRFGTGLGIPFAIKVSQAHGGKIAFERPSTGGTQVRLTLPLVQPEGIAP